MRFLQKVDIFLPVKQTLQFLAVLHLLLTSFCPAPSVPTDHRLLRNEYLVVEPLVYFQFQLHILLPTPDFHLPLDQWREQTKNL